MKNKLLKKSIRKYKIRKMMNLNRKKYSFRLIQEMYFVAIYKTLRRRPGSYILIYIKTVFFTETWLTDCALVNFMEEIKLFLSEMPFKERKDSARINSIFAIMLLLKKRKIYAYSFSNIWKRNYT